MGRKRHEGLSGLVELGMRLKDVRQKSGLSQMRLSELMGYDPKHGYKYILKLEKGQVPNPTMRTIVSYLESCGSGWSAIADVLPGTGATTTASTTRPEPREKPRKQLAKEPVTPKGRPKRRDPRPLRVRLRSEMLAERSRRADEFWALAARADAEAGRLLEARRVVTSERHDYRAFVRPCCSIISAGRSGNPRTVERELSRLVESSVESGLDRETLESIRDTCQRVMSAPGEPKA